MGGGSESHDDTDGDDAGKVGGDFTVLPVNQFLSGDKAIG